MLIFGFALYLQHVRASCSYRDAVDFEEVIKTFGDKGKIMIGHCAGAMMFDFTGITKGKKVAVHPLAKPAIQNGTATDEKSEIDGNFFTAQDENTIWTMMPQVIKALK